MADYITLLGAEQVQAAANTMREAANEMQRAASYNDDVARQQRQFMDDWLQRFEAVLETHRALSTPVKP